MLIMQIQDRLREIEAAVSSGNCGGGVEFWKITNKVKNEPQLTREFAPQIGRIDEIIFKRKAGITVGVAYGNALSILLSITGAGMLVYGLWEKSHLGIVIVLSAILLSASLHPIAHYIVGRLTGIRFLFYFLDGPIKIEPTIKTDYASYLRVSPSRRILMHLAGPVVTTIVPMVAITLGIILKTPPWSIAALAILIILYFSTEFAPLVLVKMKSTSIRGIDFRKSDIYRAFREWRLK